MYLRYYFAWVNIYGAWKRWYSVKVLIMIFEIYQRTCSVIIWTLTSKVSFFMSHVTFFFTLQHQQEVYTLNFDLNKLEFIQSDQKWWFFAKKCYTFWLLSRQFSKLLSYFSPNPYSLGYSSVKILILAFFGYFGDTIW